MKRIRKRREAPLPVPGQRWTANRKRAVVAAIYRGELNYDDALSRYGLTNEEVGSWIRAAALHGTAGLRVTRTQQYCR